MTQTPALKAQHLHVGGMDCTICATKISTALEKTSGVQEATVNFSTGKLTVAYDPQTVDEPAIRDRVLALGYRLITPEVHADGAEHGHDHTHGAEFSWKRELPSLLVILALFLVGIIFETPLHNTPYSLGEYAIFIPAYLISGWTVLKSAGRNIIRGQVFDENFLMTIATVGAIAIHKLPEAVGVMLFYKIGELFQEGALILPSPKGTGILEQPKYGLSKAQSKRPY